MQAGNSLKIFNIPVLHPSVAIFFSTVFLFTNLHAQKCGTITGKVTDSVGGSLGSVIVVIGTPEKRYYGVTDPKGNYHVEFCFLYDSSFEKLCTLSFRLIGYRNTDISRVLRVGVNQLPSTILFPTDQALNEVIVKAQPVTQRGDTTAFSVRYFANKVDANLEDVLRRMPGFDVDESGKILYDNRTIENILVEGDELAKNYKLLSKNIPPDAIDKIEMIDKYELNPLLKGLTGSRKQAMNITLRNPNHVSSFGNFKVGGGSDEKYNLSGNLFGVNRRFKSLVLANANSIGISPYDEISFDQRTVQVRDYEFDKTLVPTLVDENRLFGRSLFGGISTLFNRSKMVTANGSYKISNRLSAKLFTDQYADKVTQFQYTDFINNLFPSLSYKTNSTKLFKPVSNDFYGQLKYLTGNEQLLLTAIATRKKYFEDGNIVSSLNYQSNMGSQYERKAIGAYYTRRLDSLHLVELSMQYAHDSKSQDYNIMLSETRSIDSFYKANQLAQQTSSGIEYLRTEFRYLVKKNRRSPFEIRITDYWYRADLTGELGLRIGSVVQTPASYYNNSFIESNRVQLLLNKELAVKSWSTGISLGSAMFSNRYTSVGKTEKQIVIQPIINASVKLHLNKLSDISYGLDYNATNPGVSSFYGQPVLTSFRTFVSAVPSTRILPYVQSNLTYIYKDLGSGTSLIGSCLYFNRPYTEVSSIGYGLDFDRYTNRFSSIGQQQNTLFVKFDRYISKWKTSFNIKQSFNWFTNPMEVNGIILSNRNYVYTANVSFRPSISNVLSITSGVSVNYARDLQSGKSAWQTGPFVNTSATVTDRFSLAVNTTLYYNNYSASTNRYWFVSGYAWYSIKPSRLELKFVVNNVLNANTAFSGSRNDLYSMYSTQSILPRFGLLELMYKF